VGGSELVFPLGVETPPNRCVGPLPEPQPLLQIMATIIKAHASPAQIAKEHAMDANIQSNFFDIM
jgi:hypothetical protein